MEQIYCRPNKARDLREATQNFKKRDDLRVQEYDRAAILPVKRFAQDNLLFGRGGVVDAEGKYVALSSIELRLDGAYDVQDMPFVDERVVYCGYLVDHWGHFLIEGVARLWYYLTNPEAVDRYVFIGKIGGVTEAKANYKAFFELLGIADKMVVINQPTRYRSVIVPERAYGYRQYYTAQYNQIFERVAQSALMYADKYPKSEKVFFSRSRFPKALAYEAGLDMLDNYFARNGYEIIYPEQLGLAEMICRIRSATWCASESGSTPHNMLFAGDGQKLIIVERQSVINHVQSDIDAVKELDVTYIDGHYTIYPVPVGGGPFILAYNDLFHRFTQDMRYQEPERQFTSEKYVRKCLKHYMQAYRKDFGELLGMEEWHLFVADTIYEAYVDSCRVLRPYLTGEIPYRFGQYLNLHTIKLCAKRLLKGRR